MAIVGVSASPAEIVEAGAGQPLLTVRALERDGIDLSQMVGIDCERDLASYRLRQGDILVAARSTTLKFALVPDSLTDVAINATLLAIRTDPALLDPRVLIAYLRTDHGTRALLSVSQSGSAQINLTSAALSELLVPVPALAEQARIGALYESAEDVFRVESELARRRHRLAQAIIQSQFVSPRHEGDGVHHG